MRIHKEGFRSILVAGLFVILVGLVIRYFYPEPKPVHNILALIGIIVFLWIVSFFRVPKRKIEQDENTILSAADGTIVAIEEIIDTDYFHDKRIQVSVFMSPLNVHVNLYPCNGNIQHTAHKPGKHLPAFMPKSSMANEQSNIVIRTKNKQEILIRQIAGMMARRIVYYSKPGQIAEQGKQLGIIKFGSRVDLILPPSVKIKAKLNQKVKAGIDTIACFED